LKTKENKNDNPLKTLETILRLALDFDTMNTYIIYIKLIRRLKMFINHRQGALKMMILFIALAFAGTALLLMSGYSMTQIPHQDFAFWIMLGVFFVGVLTVTWSTLGAIFKYIDYKSLS
jgi:hypothetical protein